MKISIITKASNLFNETANGNKKIVSTSNSKNKIAKLKYFKSN